MRDCPSDDKILFNILFKDFLNMIIKKKLQKLIENNQTIYTTYGGYVSAIKIDRNTDYIQDDWFYEANIVANDTNFIKYTFNILFETKEDAEWYLEFGCIQKLQTLSLPTWKEVEKMIKNFDVGTVCIVEFEDYSIEHTKYNGEFIGLYKDCIGILTAEPTKEGYIKACKKLKEIFQGE